MRVQTLGEHKRVCELEAKRSREFKLLSIQITIWVDSNSSIAHSFTVVREVRRVQDR